MLTAHIASLSAVIKRHNSLPDHKEFGSLVNNINDKFKRVESTLNGEIIKPALSNRNAPITNKVQLLMRQRQQEMEQGLTHTQTNTRISLRELKSITDEFEIIDSIVDDEIKIAKRLMQ